MGTRMRHTSALAAGSAASGLLAYVFFSIVTRQLGSVAAAPVSVLWVWWSFASAALTFPVQHWIARSVATHGGERAVRDALPQLAVLALTLAAVMSGLSWLGRDLLFHEGQRWFPVLVGGVTLGSAAMGVTRGVLTARGRFGAVAVGLVGENGVRCLAAALLVAADVGGPVAYGLSLLLGYIGAFAWPSTYHLDRAGRPGDESPMAVLGGAGTGQVLGQAVLTGGPVVLAVAGGAAEDVTVLFAALALFRAPYILGLGAVAQVTGIVSRMVLARRDDQLRRVRRLLVSATAVGCLGAALVGVSIGPPLLRLVFGPDIDLAAGLAVVVAVASTIALANLVATVVVIAQGRAPVLVACWLLALVPGAAWYLVSDRPLLARTCWALLLVEAMAFGLLVLAERRGTAALVAARD